MAVTPPFFRRFPRSVHAMVAAIALLGAAGGCSMFDRLSPLTTDYERPKPSQNDFGPSAADPIDARTIVVGVFEDPSHNSVPKWTNVGSQMANMLERSILNHGTVAVIVNPRLARDVQNLRELDDGVRASRLKALQAAHPRVRLVVNGRVTDFVHTDDIHPSLRRSNGVGRNRREALVAIQLDVFDLKLGRTVGTDHIIGTASTSRTNTDELYANVALDSYVFWSTPLGRASTEAVEQAIDRLDLMVPAASDRLVITDHDPATRRVTISIASGRPLRAGQRFYLYRLGAGEDATLLIDPALDSPSVAVIDRDGRSRTTAFLFSPPDPDIDLRGVVLRPIPAAVPVPTS